jgi:hypothetical protein
MFVHYIIIGCTLLSLFVLFLVIGKTLNNTVNLLTKLEFLLEKDLDISRENLVIQQAFGEEGEGEAEETSGQQGGF